MLRWSMDYKLCDLVDIERLQTLLDHLYDATGIPSGIIGADGEIITATGWRDICTKFHRVNPETNSKCIESDTSISDKIKEGERYIVSHCKNGLVDIGSPILVDGKHVATIFQGQFFFNEPDIEFFRKQSRAVGFDEEDYIEEILKTPVISENQIKKVVVFLTDLAEFIADIGFSNLSTQAAYNELNDNHQEITAVYEELVATEEDLREHFDLLKESNFELNKSKERYKLVTEGAHDIIWDINLIDDKIFLSEQFEKVYKINRDSINGLLDMRLIIHPNDYEEVHSRFLDCLRNPVQYDYQYSDTFRTIDSENNVIWISSKARILTDKKGKAIRIAGSFRDVTDTIDYQKGIEKMAFTDSLTKTFNRNQLMSDLRKLTFEIENNNNLKLATMFLDLDNFKNINDVYGHTTGDGILELIAKRLKKFSGEDVSVYRFGGDEFALIIKNHNKNMLKNKANNILKSFKDPIFYMDKPFYITASIGICPYPECASSPDGLLRNSDIAMYNAKSKGKNSFVMFEEAMHKSTITKRKIEESLNHAIDKEEFFLVFQPKIEISTGKVYGFESLIRWRLSKNKIVAPYKFIPIAEERGLIENIDHWVIRNVFKTVAEWTKKGYDFNIISINLSPMTLNENIVPYLRKMSEIYLVSPDKIQIEVTENVLIESYEMTSKLISDIRKMGYTVALDDFGKGYSSLSHLKNLPIDILKIDKLFVDEIVNDESIVDLIIEIGQRYKMKIVAEGVERKDQLDVLTSYGCDYYQGYYHSKPMEKSKIEKVIFGII
jgi:diguanylate cyclase (GGDEF)-like protein/PAS domain S-box-containing protein